MGLQMETMNFDAMKQVQGHGQRQIQDKSDGSLNANANANANVSANANANGNGLARTKSIGNVKDLPVAGNTTNSRTNSTGMNNVANTNSRSNSTNANANANASASAVTNTNAQANQASHLHVQFIRSTSIKVERKGSSKRAAIVDDEGMEDSVEILARVNSVMDPTNTRGLDELCLNCGRDVRVEGEVFVTDIGKFCGKNCHWSVLLDESNLRSRTQPVRTRNVTMNTQGQPGMAMSKTSHAAAMRAAASMQEYSHAIYQYQQEYEVSKRGGLSRKGSIRLGQQNSQ
mmetsp:Transcript_15535/g.27291  ORF Transcript_15535/g.27291 Transcript_15535/m.27291 type:complete len:288 (-) Transcript_15535:268-1131(-)